MTPNLETLVFLFVGGLVFGLGVAIGQEVASDHVRDRKHERRTQRMREILAADDQERGGNDE